MKLGCPSVPPGPPIGPEARSPGTADPKFSTGAVNSTISPGPPPHARSRQYHNPSVLEAEGLRMPFSPATPGSWLPALGNTSQRASHHSVAQCKSGETRSLHLPFVQLARLFDSAMIIPCTEYFVETAHFDQIGPQLLEGRAVMSLCVEPSLAAGCPGQTCCND